MRRRRIIAAAAVATLTVALGACNSSSGGTSTASGGGDKPYIAIVSKGFQHQFWQAVKKGAEEEAAKQGARITFEGPATEADVEAQVTMLTNALAKKPAAIGFAALDSKAAAPLLQQAKSAKIPVIAFDSGVDSDIPVTTASTDNKAAAAEAAKHMSDLLGGKGKVALVVHDQTSRSGIDRRDGFLEWMKANAPGITVLPPQYGGGDQAKSADITKSIIAANPDIAGIYGSNEGSAIGVIKGVEESGKKGIKIVGFDSGKAQIDAIKNGTMAGAITQNPIGIGQQLVIAAMKAIKGENQPKVIDTGFYWYDKTNIDKPEIAAVLYQ
ncbi:BMP family ABC transporter substrate-binding protein [Micromonospora globispora]|uniref:BMP family ABC transporter substrate-binding protein n=1 Tax=Micromonospora globispora TaxID=1450148 RepID=A0A317K5C2_9ACTN|nr:BMP family ABC transporter substrate-binding protein [Micromonospora globispora]PWU60972.1 BMP family ABC transporter substrate-binding protein [Micromonospora globispora]RQW82856.1 BMP family ABC transporter substrate-binding protein [Micromonospora globispora]